MTLQDKNVLSAQELEGRFDLLVADAREYAVFLVAPEGRILCWNPGAERLFGYQSNEIVDEHFSRFFSAEDIRSGQPEHELKAAHADGRTDSVRWQVRKDGTRFWCMATVTPLLNATKQVRSFVRVMHDLTDGQAQAAQKKRADDLADANRSKEEFMALLSHELRTPLSPILNALSIQRQIKTDDPILQQAGDVIERQIGQMVRLVDDLLDISRITKGKLRLTKEPVELRVIVNRAAQTARPLIDARKHEFSLSLPMEPLWVEGDPGRLEQIFVNLLNNAAKYTDPPGLIRVVVKREADEAVVRVADNGVGIPPEMLSHVFDLFTQVDGVNLGRSHGGLGIGLALVATLAEMHEGRVQAFSSGLGKGSEFSVRLPALASAPVQPATVATERVNQSGRCVRVLIVEDDVDTGDSLSMLLQLEGHEVLLARSGATALEVAASFRPELVLCDIGLPGMDGYKLAERLRALPQFERVIMCALTGYTPSEADRRRPEEAGFDHHFVKPLNSAKLLELLKTIG